MLKGRKLEPVTSFIYLEAMVSDEGSLQQVLSRIGQTAATVTKLRPFCQITTNLLEKKAATDALPNQCHISVCLLDMDLDLDQS